MAARHPVPKKVIATDNTLKPQLSQFNVLRFETTGTKVLSYSRRDYYKIWIVNTTGHIHYANRSIYIDRPALIFSNPLVPYAFESLTPNRSGYMCIFTDGFLKASDRQESILQSPLLKIGSDPVFFLDDEQLKMFSGLYDKMIAEYAADYAYKYDLLRNYVYLVIHEAMKMQPAMAAFRYHNATTRIAGLFIELLERQFPIDSPGRALQLKKPADYAFHLSVHVNHLNYAVKEATGKPTSVHISERIVNEAKALLRNTNWAVADIAYSLGFEYPAYFNNFFKKHTGTTPLALRK